MISHPAIRAKTDLTGQADTHRQTQTFAQRAPVKCAPLTQVNCTGRALAGKKGIGGKNAKLKRD